MVLNHKSSGNIGSDSQLRDHNKFLFTLRFSGQATSNRSACNREASRETEPNPTSFKQVWPNTSIVGSILPK